MTTSDPAPGASPPTPEGALDTDLVSKIANEFYADTPPHQPESAVPKSDPVRGRDVTEEASSLTDVANVPENLLGLQGVASPHGLADPAYYFLEHPETPEMPQGTPTTPAIPTPTDAMHPESSVDPLSAQGAGSQAGSDASPAAAGGQQMVPEDTGFESALSGYGAQPAADEPPGDAPRSMPSEPPSPASADASRPESGFDPTQLQAMAAPMLTGIPSIYGVPEAGSPATPDFDLPALGAIATGPGKGGASPGAGAPDAPGEAPPSDAGASAPPPDMFGLAGAPALTGLLETALPMSPDLDAAGFDLTGLGIPALGSLTAEPPAAPAEAPTESESADPGANPGYYFLPADDVPQLEQESSAGLDPNVIREDFPILQQKVHGKPLIWMDNAATTQKPQAVIDSISHFYERDYSNIHRGAHTLAARATDAYEDAREKVRRFLGADSSDEVIFVRGATEGVNLVAQTWGRKNVRAGDEILLTTLEHHANIVPWQMLAQEKGAKLVAVPVTDEGEVILEEYARLLGPRTRLVGVTHVSNALGTVNPVEEMVAAAHRHGVPVLVDGAQSVPHHRVDLQSIGADFFVFSAHKVYGPSGVGVVFGKKEHLEDMPPWQGGGNMIQTVTFEHTTYSKPPAKFEAGTPTIADAVGLGAAIDYVDRIGIDNISRYEHALTEYAMERLPEVPDIRLIGTAPGKVSVLSFVIDGTRVEDVARYLDSEGIAVRGGHHCAMPTMHRMGVTGTVRPSLAIYNTRAEVDYLVDVLKKYRDR